MAIGTRYQGQAPPESTRTEKAKLLTSSSSKPAVGEKRSHADQQTSESSDSEPDSPASPPPPKKKKPDDAKNPRKRGHRKAANVEVVELDDVANDTASGEGNGNGVIEILDSEEGVEAASGAREKGKQRAVPDSLREKRSDTEDGARDSDSDLNLPDETTTKAESTADLLTIFSMPVTTEFKSKKNGTSDTERGRWCMICNCRRHIASMHYAVYVARCKAEGIEETEQATPKKIWAAKMAKKDEKKKAAAAGGAQLQLTLDGVVKKVESPTVFSRTAILDAVTQHVVCGDQALLVADDPTFTNCLVVMRPKTTKEELPSRAVVRTNIKNKFVQFIKELRSDLAAAPGKASINHDLWTEDHSSTAFFGITAQWIDVKDLRPWTLRAEVIGFHKIVGDHGGRNLGRHLLKVTDRAGITSKKQDFVNKLGHITADNASNNGTTAREVAEVLEARGIDDWDAVNKQLGCIGHVVQLAIEDFMTAVTQVGLVESKQAMWDYDPKAPENRVLAGGLDVIAAIRTLAIKIQASPQRKEAFQQTQKQFNIEIPLVIPLHTATRWGSALKMLKRSSHMSDPITSFTATADAKFGPITTIRKNGKVTKKIPWSAFRLEKEDWDRVGLCVEILEDADKYHQLFSSDKVPTLHRVVPALEALCTKWEKKLDDPKYAVFHPALQAGLDKLNKYYTKLDNSDVYILALLLHPYYKLRYIEKKWGGHAEQQAEIAAGNFDAINWIEHAREVVNTAMEHYWPLRLGQQTNTSASGSSGGGNNTSASGGRRTRSGPAGGMSSDSEEDDFDRERAQLVNSESSSGWKQELRAYLEDPALTVKKDCDTVEWWSKFSYLYPTLARMALDILPIPASSVAVERLFSRAKEVSTDRRSRIGADLFEWLECLSHHWRPTIVDYAKVNSAAVEEVDLDDFVSYYEVDELWNDPCGADGEALIDAE
uniref:C2H2-type domain-containing protein n=1 Tax=Ganoderma boninense TaxID=34458 RepID=A0A5K1JWC0_9APHY|nr:C2H2-type domain-containing protein [Ganoderma boninense]